MGKGEDWPIAKAPKANVRSFGFDNFPDEDLLGKGSHQLDNTTKSTLKPPQKPNKALS